MSTFVVCSRLQRDTDGTQAKQDHHGGQAKGHHTLYGCATIRQANALKLLFPEHHVLGFTFCNALTAMDI